MPSASNGLTTGYTTVSLQAIPSRPSSVPKSCGEYGEEYPAIAVAGYTVATGIGFLRMYNNRHWASDVLAGAGIGILSASLMYWLAPYLTF